MDAKLEKLETALSDINVFNAGKKREEAVALLGQLLPEIKSFQAEMQRMQETVAQSLSMQRGSDRMNALLKDELDAERRKGDERHAKLVEMEARCERAERLLSKVPKEVLEWSAYVGKSKQR